MIRTRIGVYADYELESGCIEEWLDRLEELHDKAFRVDVDSWTSYRLNIFQRLSFDEWPRAPVKKNKGPVFKILEEQQGDLCEGVGRIRFDAGRFTHRLLGFFEEHDNRFVIYVADTFDRRGEKSNPDFFTTACRLVRVREMKAINGEGEIHECEY